MMIRKHISILIIFSLLISGCHQTAGEQCIDEIEINIGICRELASTLPPEDAREASQILDAMSKNLEEYEDSYLNGDPEVKQAAFKNIVVTRDLLNAYIPILKESQNQSSEPTLKTPGDTVDG